MAGPRYLRVYAHTLTPALFSVLCSGIKGRCSGRGSAGAASTRQRAVDPVVPWESRHAAWLLWLP